MAGANGSGGVHVEHESLRTQATKARRDQERDRAGARALPGADPGASSRAASSPTARRPGFGDAHDRWNTAAKNCIAEARHDGHLPGQGQRGVRQRRLAVHRRL
nr:hypothetical protein [Angustibacter aerolatus]